MSVDGGHPRPLREAHGAAAVVSSLIWGMRAYMQEATNKATAAAAARLRPFRRKRRAR